MPSAVAATRRTSRSLQRHALARRLSRSRARRRPRSDDLRVVWRAAGAHSNVEALLREVRSRRPAPRAVIRDDVGRSPERVAKWLGEVFCGPSSYSEEYGGYSRMLSQHLGKGLTEDQRARWVTLLLRSAQETGLPNDAEFRSAFRAYIEWGSRLAVNNSQSSARPPEHMPMPRLDWHTAAGSPGSRISALAPPVQDRQEVVLPGLDEPVGFERKVKAMFRPTDRRSMSFAFDLWSYDDVAQRQRHPRPVTSRHHALRWCLAACESRRLPAVDRRWQGSLSQLSLKSGCTAGSVGLGVRCPNS